MGNLRLDLEVAIELHFDLVKPEPMTRHYPGHPGYVEVNAISIMDVEVSQRLFRELMREYEDVFIDEILDKVSNDERGPQQKKGIFSRYIERY